MKKLSIVFLILINSLACSKGQNKQYSDNANLSTEILGCWRLIDITYEIKSNYSFVDSLILQYKKEEVEDKKNTPHVIKFSNDYMDEFDENNKISNNPTNYFLDNDSIFTRGILRQDKFSAKIDIQKDTLKIESDFNDQYQNALIDLKWDYEINTPNDIKIETAKRYATFVRVPDCDQYKKED